jgi:hypothetical protein
MSLRHRLATFVRRFALGAAAFALPAVGALAQPVVTEAQLKAAFVLNFARYVEWPASAFPARETPVQACVLGRETLAAALVDLESRPVQGRTLRVRRVATNDELRGCHVVFVGDGDDRRVAATLRALAGQPVLTVGDSDRFLDVGGAIAIVHGDDRLQFEISRPALERAGLKASAYLLRLARNL